MVDRLVVSGARGASWGDVARRSGAFGVQPTDSDEQALEKFADFAIQENPAFKGDKGNPGGNVLAVGLFTEIDELEIPEGVDIIQTSGRNAIGVGAARYARTETTGETAYRTQSADGAWWELEGGLISADMMGPPSDPIAAAEAAYDLIRARMPRISAGIERVDVTVFGVNPGNAPAVNRERLQAAINKSYGRELFIPNFGEGVGADIEFDADPETGTGLAISPIYDGANRPIAIRGAGHDGDGGFSGTRLKYTGTTGHAIEVVNPTEPNGISADTQLSLSGFGLYGNGLNQDGAGGIKVVRTNGGFIMERLWVQGFNENGVEFHHCYGAKFADSIIIRSRKDGVAIVDRCNNILLDNVKTPGNAHISGLYANIRIAAGEGYECLGPSIRTCDWSYAGLSPFKRIDRANGTLTSIVVASTVGTVNAENHGYKVGDRIAVRGAVTALQLDSPFGYAITSVPNANSFKFATSSVPNGTYVEATLSIFPYSYGLLVTGAKGLSVLNYYAEQCAGPNAYFGGTTESLFVANGYNQDGWLFVEGIRKARFGPIYHQCPEGYRGGAYLNLAGDHEVSISRADTFTAGAQFVLPDPVMFDGAYRGTAAPSTGTWTAGARVENSMPTAGGIPGWVCVVGGTPGTWKAMANIAA